MRSERGVSPRLVWITASDGWSITFPGAMVTGHRSLIDSMKNHPKDRHVLAAAVRGHAELIVTQNTRDFPARATKPFDIEAVDQDTFLLDQFDVAPEAAHRALARQVSRSRRQPCTVDDVLIGLGGIGNGCPNFAKDCHTYGAAD